MLLPLLVVKHAGTSLSLFQALSVTRTFVNTGNPGLGVTFDKDCVRVFSLLKAVSDDDAGIASQVCSKD